MSDIPIVIPDFFEGDKDAITQYDPVEDRLTEIEDRYHVGSSDIKWQDERFHLAMFDIPWLLDLARTLLTEVEVVK